MTTEEKEIVAAIIAGDEKIRESWEWAGGQYGSAKEQELYEEALLARSKMPVMHYVEAPSYAGSWDGGESFGRTICSDYYFGARVYGEKSPVNVEFLGFGNKTYKAIAWRAIGEVEISVICRGGKKYKIPSGDLYTTNSEFGRHGRTPHSFQPMFGAITSIQEVAPYVREVNGTVDSLGRW